MASETEGRMGVHQPIDGWMGEGIGAWRGDRVKGTFSFSLVIVIGGND